MTIPRSGDAQPVIPSRPRARGPWSQAAFDIMTGRGVTAMPAPPEAPLSDDDFQLALYLCYELSYHGVPGVADELEWDPTLLSFRRDMEAVFEAAVSARVPVRPVAPGAVPELLRQMDAASTMPLARFLAAEATLDQVREFVIHRSAYQLKEADPQSFAIPRLRGRAKAAFVEIQADEYGGGDPARVHATLFAGMMRHLGLDSSYGAYVDRIPGTSLANVNLMSLFGLHRRWRGAVVGHLALFELGSARPNRLYGDGMRRLGFGPEATDFHDEHVEADAVHAMIATYDMAGSLAVDEPELAPDIVFGARALEALEGDAGEHLLSSWRAGRSSLLGGAT